MMVWEIGLRVWFESGMWAPVVMISSLTHAVMQCRIVAEVSIFTDAVRAARARSIQDQRQTEPTERATAPAQPTVRKRKRGKCPPEADDV